MSKTNTHFVQNNLDTIIKKSFANSLRHFEIAKLLRGKQYFSSSLFHSITALEELAKWHFLKQNSIDYSKLEKITDHIGKIDEIAKIFQEINNNHHFKKDDSDWLKNNRIKTIRLGKMFCM